MKRPVRSIALLGASAVASAGLAVAGAPPVSADSTPQPLPFAQDWSDPALITSSGDWSAVPGIVGHLGDYTMGSPTAVDPQTVLVAAASGTQDVIADATTPSTLGAGGVAEFAIDDPVVALQGSGTADAPNLVVTFDATARRGVTVAYDVRDIDAQLFDAVQPVALQYRIGSTGEFTNVPAGFVADATAGASQATNVTAVLAALPATVDGQPLVQVRILTTNAAGSDEWVGIDRIAVTGTETTGPASPIASCPAALPVDGARGGSAAVGATDADSSISEIAITSLDVPGIALTAGAPGQATLVVAPGTDTGSYPVHVRFTSDDGETTSCDIAVAVLDVVPVSAVQGSSATSPMVGEPAVVEAVVTSPFTTADAVTGAFVQDEAADGDDLATTSEGLFVHCGAACPAGLAKGAVVRAFGVVRERSGTTQIVSDGPDATSIVGTADVPDPVILDRPDGAATEGTYESIEGMVVTFTGTLTLREHFNMARYGEIELYADGVPYTQTHVGEPVPGTEAAYERALGERTLVLDDDNDDENDAIRGPQADEPYPFPTASWGDPGDGLSIDHRLRIGDTTTGVTGVLQWSFGAWRMRPVPGLAYELTPGPQHDPGAAPADVGGRLRVASFNVLNYFATPDTTAAENQGPCGPNGDQDCRGADSEAERVRQLDKITTALAAMRPDVVGLIEIENDDGQATQDIADALNARLATSAYTPVVTGAIGTDAIKVAFIYRSDAVRTVGDPEILDSSVDPRFVDTRNRPALIQTFEEVATGERFTAAINHFKSKGSSCAAALADGVIPADPDLGDGAGNCNLTRTAAAAALAAHLATDPTGSGDPDVLILGDLNAYRNEDPIDVLRAAGYTDLVRAFVGDPAYSYLFDGAVGYLDHALGSAAITPQVTGVTEWHINAAEPELFDYNDTEQTIGEAADFERKSSALPLYADDARRASDHDPVLVGLDLASLSVDDAVVIQSPRGGGSAIVSGSTGAATAGCPTLTLTMEGREVFSGPTRQVGGTTTCTSVTSRGIVSFDRRTGDFAAVLTLPSSFRLSGEAVAFDLRVVDGATTSRYSVDRPGRRLGLIWTSS